ncbi:uncharacterized protein LOC6575411 isoform X1 [Drosophila mojavensis]|uniref:uncharacterized protein LOC6575411 isoform X1 n=1 Tax=Drosophila mojavensis TaxID=7230 RepID=UPI0013EE80F2|nr:uncharacterized protein LOC6575411 isoform X1 [Drosophila mojavensis]XP_032586112.1 uncharacterized protein LOC6575411 isoform X1 [Drosophila mojavensis]XP_032586114.1 uncharacterized protein LOC6575411 isoform X1 [Drosophila mojavensis]
MNRTTQTKLCHALPVLLLTLLLLCVDHTASRPSTENEGDTSTLPPGADNIEIHHVEVVDGVNHEDHPVIMYKEDFVNEDYDPTKNETKSIYPKLYKRTQRTRHHHSRATAQPAVEEEKILFDVLPETPLILSDDDDKSKQRTEEPTKEASLHKYPKKYHRRHRRHAYNQNVRQLYRNDLYAPQPEPVYYHSVPAPHYLPIRPVQYYRYPTIGKPPKYQGKLPFWRTDAPPKEPASIGTRLDTDDENSLFHNSNPADADFSVFDQPQPNNTIADQNNNNNYWPVQEVEQPPIWSPSEARRPGISAPVFQSPPWAITLQPRPQTLPQPQQQPRPMFRQDAVLFPQESSYASGTACHRASQQCCSLESLGPLYDCFHRRGCEQHLAEILSTCS